MSKEQLKKAFDAGQYSVHFNKEIERLIEGGSKSCPAEITFDSWFDSQNDSLPKKTIPTERTFTETEISHLQHDIHKITGDGEVMMLFNKLLGINAGGGS